MATPILFRGGEDIDFSIIGGAKVESASTIRGIYWSTTAANYRSTYSRGALVVNANIQDSNQNTWFLRAPFSASSEFWFSCRIRTTSGNNISNTVVSRFLSFEDGSTRRLQIRMVGSGASPQATGSNWQVETVTASGTVTQIGSTWSGGISDSPSSPHKLDIYVRYGTSGQITVYINSVRVYDFQGDVTTDTATTLSSVTLGSVGATSNNSAASHTAWSEVIVSTRDTRNMSLLTRVSGMEGNAVQWDTAPTIRDNSSAISGASATHVGWAANDVIFRQIDSNHGLNGKLDHVAFQINSGGGSGNFQAGIYTSNSQGFPGTRLAASNLVPGGGAGSTMVFTFSTPLVLSVNSPWWVGIYCPVSTTPYPVQASTLDRVWSGQTGGLPTNVTVTPGTYASRYTAIEFGRTVRGESPSVVDVSVSSSDTAGEIMQLCPGMDLATGLQVVDIAVTARAACGTTGPSKLGLGVRSGGTDFWASDHTLTTDWATYTDVWDHNPATGADWSYTDLAGDGSFNFGLRSAA